MYPPIFHLSKIISAIFYTIVLIQLTHAQRYKTIYQKIRQELAYTGFSALIGNNRVAKLNLHFDNLTLFVPENNAFKNNKGEYRSEIVFYHMSFQIMTLEKLKTTRWMPSAFVDFPPLWITNVGEDIFVNNAKILQDKSQYVSLPRSGDMSKEQILHMVDEVLDPGIPSPRVPPTAYHFLSSTKTWNLDASKTVASFFHKVQENNLAEIYQRKGGHTFFIPIDSGINPREFKMIKKQIIYGHIVPNQVLFTRPTEKNVLLNTMAVDKSMYILISFEENYDRVYIRGLAGGDLGNGNGEDGEFVSEIIVPNIPVTNGVIHLISKPLGIFNATLKSFPYLPILDKLVNDPELSVFYDMGEKTRFNEQLKEENTKFTYFVPRDSSWTKTRKHGLQADEDDLDILNRHLMVSDTPYSMERLFALSHANNYSDIELNTEAGVIKMTVLKIDKEYYIKWAKNYIRVVRPDYECTNGLIHILAAPFIRFKTAGYKNTEILDELHIQDNSNVYDADSAMDKYWTTLKTVWKNIF